MGAYTVLTRQSPGELAVLVRGWASVGLGFAATILGFPIAGFTIFSTLTAPELLAQMAVLIEKKSGLTYLKYNFFVFFETFGWYVGFAGLCVIVLVFGAGGGPISLLTHSLPANLENGVRQIIVRVTVLVVSVWFVQLCLELESFVFNIYHVVMTSVRFACEFGANRSVDSHHESVR
jgi:hypothetical protein